MSLLFPVSLPRHWIIFARTSKHRSVSPAVFESGCWVLQKKANYPQLSCVTSEDTRVRPSMFSVSFGSLEMTYRLKSVTAKQYKQCTFLWVELYSSYVYSVNTAAKTAGVPESLPTSRDVECTCLVCTLRYIPPVLGECRRLNVCCFFLILFLSFLCANVFLQGHICDFPTKVFSTNYVLTSRNLSSFFHECTKRQIRSSHPHRWPLGYNNAVMFIGFWIPAVAMAPFLSTCHLWKNSPFYLSFQHLYSVSSPLCPQMFVAVVCIFLLHL